MTKLNPDHVAWSRRTFDIISDGGSWGVPRSGLVFNKRGGKLVLVARLPHDKDMPCSAKELAEAQQSDYDQTKLHFEAAGISVEDASTP